MRSLWLGSAPWYPGQRWNGKTTSAMFKEENEHQVFTAAEKVHKNGRMSKAGTLQESEAIFLNVPPKIKGENHTERRPLSGPGQQPAT